MNWKSAASVVVPAALAALWVSAQAPRPQAAQAQPQQGPVFSTNVREVPLVFSAVDRDNRFVDGLQKEQIQVLDNDKLQVIRRFEPQHNLPLHIALVLDVSTSISSRWDFEQHASLDFLQSVLVPGRDQALVVAFDTQVNVVQDFTDNFEKLSAAVHAEHPGGGTAFNDAIYLTAHDKLGPASGSDVRNVIVVVSDGDDNQSRFSRQEALEEAQNIGAVVYTIGTEPTGSNNSADNVLRDFARSTGGSSFFPIAARDLGDAFVKIQNELRNQYLVSYNPNDFVANGAFHKVEIKVHSKGVSIRVRKGYYATPNPSG